MRQGWRLRTIMWGKKNFYYFIQYISLIPSLGQMAFNVPAVTEVWAGIQGLCEAKTARPNLGEGGVGMA